MSPDIQAVLAGSARWCVIHGDCRDVLPQIPAADVCLQDPPYSEHVHGKQRRMLRGSGGLAAKGQKAGRGEIGFAPLGFDAITAAEMETVADLLADRVKRWVLTFCDAESAHRWQGELTTSGLEHVRIGAWIKIAGQPQLSGDRPAVGFEAIHIAHRPGPKRWNGGGLPAVWSHAIATDRNGTGARVHTTQKPLSLMLELVEQFTEPDELVIDPYCGSATTGIACRMLGRRFIGIEKSEHYAVIAKARMRGDMPAPRAGQMSLWGGV